MIEITRNFKKVRSFHIYILFFFLIIVYNSCCNENKETENLELIVDDIEYDYYALYKGKSLKKLVIEDGDWEAYGYLYNQFFKTYEFFEILPYSMIMANKWGNPRSMYDIYLSFLIMYAPNTSITPKTISEMDSVSRRIALDYLVKSYNTSLDESFKEWIYDSDIEYLVNEGYLLETYSSNKERIVHVVDDKK